MIVKDKKKLLGRIGMVFLHAQQVRVEQSNEGWETVELRANTGAFGCGSSALSNHGAYYFVPNDAAERIAEILAGEMG